MHGGDNAPRDLAPLPVSERLIQACMSCSPTENSPPRSAYQRFKGHPHALIVWCLSFHPEPLGRPAVDAIPPQFKWNIQLTIRRVRSRVTVAECPVETAQPAISVQINLELPPIRIRPSERDTIQRQ